MGKSALVGQQVLIFSRATKSTLREIAARLSPHLQEIVERWVEDQMRAWSPPGLTRGEMLSIFGDLFQKIVTYLLKQRQEECIRYLTEAGRKLAEREFPFQAVIMSLHFMEESYLTYLLGAPLGKTMQWITEMDEFLHASIAAIAVSYFEEFRKSLLEEAEFSRMLQESHSPKLPNKALDLEIG